MLHFFYGIPRLVFLTMPIAYLFFHLYFINASALALALASYVLPYMALAHVANARMQGRFRHSFWAEVYESVLAWYIALPTTLAFLSPRHGRFNVTAKGGRIDEGYVDWATSRPYLALFVLNVAAIAAGGVRLAASGGDEASTILMNVAWALYNLAMLGAALAVAREAKQVRVTHRVAMRVPATLLLADGTTAACHTKDYSAGGRARRGAARAHRARRYARRMREPRRSPVPFSGARDPRRRRASRRAVRAIDARAGAAARAVHVRPRGCVARLARRAPSTTMRSCAG